MFSRHFKNHCNHWSQWSIKFRDHRSCGNGDINSYINSSIDALEKAEVTISTHYIERLLKSGILIYISEVSDTMEEQREKEEGNCKALCVSREHKNIENKTKPQYHGKFIYLVKM